MSKLTILQGRKPIELPGFLPRLFFKSSEPETYTPGLYDVTQILADVHHRLERLQDGVGPREVAELEQLMTLVNVAGTLTKEAM